MFLVFYALVNVDVVLHAKDAKKLFSVSKTHLKADNVQDFSLAALF